MLYEVITENTKKHGITLYGLGHPNQGVVHVVGPELGHTQPGMTVVCGDSHTATHGAFGAVAFGIGTSRITSYNVCYTKLLREGVNREEEVVSINIPAGVAEGMQLNVSGKGNAARRGGSYNFV